MSTTIRLRGIKKTASGAATLTIPNVSAGIGSSLVVMTAMNNAIGHATPRWGGHTGVSFATGIDLGTNKLTSCDVFENVTAGLHDVVLTFQVPFPSVQVACVYEITQIDSPAEFLMNPLGVEIGPGVGPLTNFSITEDLSPTTIARAIPVAFSTDGPDTDAAGTWIGQVEADLREGIDNLTLHVGWYRVPKAQQQVTIGKAGFTSRNVIGFFFGFQLATQIIGTTTYHYGLVRRGANENIGGNLTPEVEARMRAGDRRFFPEGS